MVGRGGFLVIGAEGMTGRVIEDNTNIS